MKLPHFHLSLHLRGATWEKAAFTWNISEDQQRNIVENCTESCCAEFSYIFGFVTFGFCGILFLIGVEGFYVLEILSVIWNSQTDLILFAIYSCLCFALSFLGLWIVCAAQPNKDLFPFYRCNINQHPRTSDRDKLVKFTLIAFYAIKITSLHSWMFNFQRGAGNRPFFNSSLQITF